MAIKSYLLIDQLELQKNGVREKSFVGVLVFGHPLCSSKNSTEFNAEHETTWPFPCHIASNIPAFWDMQLHAIVRKISFYNFLYMYLKYVRNNSYKNLFFSFSSLQYLNSKTIWKCFSQKEKVVIFFPTGNFY